MSFMTPMRRTPFISARAAAPGSMAASAKACSRRFMALLPKDVGGCFFSTRPRRLTAYQGAVTVNPRAGGGPVGSTVLERCVHNRAERPRLPLLVDGGGHGGLRA